MKKSLLNVITLALVLINLILTVLLTFSLVTTSKKTDNLITKIAGIIDLDVAGTSGTSDSGSSSGSSSVELSDLDIIDVSSGTGTDPTKITVSITGNDGKIHYAVVNVALSLNKKSKDYESLKETVNNGMKLIVNEVNSTVSAYTVDNAIANKSTMESQLLTKLQDMFKSDIIYNVSFTGFIVQ